MPTYINENAADQAIAHDPIIGTGPNASTLQSITTSLAQNEKQTANKVSIPSPLRIATHYYYEDDDDKLTLLKSLGFNCIWINKGVPFLTDSTRTLAFLDKLYNNGISVIFYVNADQLDGTVNSESTWFNAIKDHNAVIGFSHTDEPFDQLISNTTTEQRYQNIKNYTDKLVFIVDPGNHANSFTSRCFDILLMDIYLTGSDNLINADIETIKRTIYYRYLSFYKRDPNGLGLPKKFIPMFPLFSQGTNYAMPNQRLLQTMLDTYALFGVSDYAAFGFNIKSIDSSFTAIEDSSLLQKYCHFIRSYLYNNNQDIVYIRPKNLKADKHYVSSPNILYGSTYNNLYVDSAQSSGSIVLNLQKDSSFNEIYFYFKAHNQGGGNTHTINVSMSLDGDTYEQVKTYSLPPTISMEKPDASDVSSIITLPTQTTACFVKFELVFNGSADHTAIGFQEISCTII